MKKKIITLVAALALAASGFGQIIASDNFNSYNNAALVGQGTWAQTGASATNPIQVSNGVVALTTTGQDANLPFASTFTLADYSGISFSMDINVSSAGTGDYFAHLNVNSTNFFERIFAKSSGSGYVLGLVDTSGTGSTPTYGTTVLDFNTTYNIDATWNFVAGGTNNDTFGLVVTPSGGPSSLYLTHAWTSATVEATTLVGFGLRQGTTGSAPALTLDNLQVTGLTAIPEPSTYAVIMGVLTLGFIVWRRRQKV